MQDFWGSLQDFNAIMRILSSAKVKLDCCPLESVSVRWGWWIKLPIYNKQAGWSALESSILYLSKAQAVVVLCDFVFCQQVSGDLARLVLDASQLVFKVHIPSERSFKDSIVCEIAILIRRCFAIRIHSEFGGKSFARLECGRLLPFRREVLLSTGYPSKSATYPSVRETFRN